MPARRRDYRAEYDRYHGTRKQKRRRAQRNAARRKMARAGKVRKGDRRDVHHRNGKRLSNRLSDLQVMSRAKNRSHRRVRGGRRRSAPPPKWLSLAVVKAARPFAANRGVSKTARSSRGFTAAFVRARGWRGMSDRWHDRRYGFIARHRAQGGPWWEDDPRGGTRPTRRHLAMVMWAWSPTPARFARWLKREKRSR